MKSKFLLLLATAPFILFILGYTVSYFLINSALYQTPNLVGVSLSQALNLASQNHATIKLLCEQEAPGIEPGTIISQKPCAGRVIKQNQTILVTIAKETPPTKAPDLILQNLKECQKTAKELGISLKSYPITYPLGKNICIGQIPEKETVLTDKKMAIYTAQEKANIYIMPNFIGKNLHMITSKLHQQQINYKVFKDGENIIPPFSNSLTIVNQKPKAGSFVAINETFVAQLETEV